MNLKTSMLETALTAFSSLATSTEGQRLDL